MLLAVAGSVSSAGAHHPGAISGARVLIDDSREGYRAALEISPADPNAGSPIEFLLWVIPEGTGNACADEARLWIQHDLSPPAPPMMIPTAERGRGAGSVLYRARHRFDREGKFRVEVDLPSLQARWAGSLRVEQASPWFRESGKLMAFVGLVGVFVVFLEWWKRRNEKTP